MNQTYLILAMDSKMRLWQERKINVTMVKDQATTSTGLKIFIS